MSVSSINSGYQLIQKSQHLSEEAAVELSNTSEPSDLAFNKVQITEPKEKLETSPSKFSPDDPLVKLQLAKTYNQTGATLIQRSNDIIGTILDTHV